MCSADTLFSKTLKCWAKSPANNKLHFEGEIYTLNISGDPPFRIGFYNSLFCTKNVRSNRWIKPDAVLLRERKGLDEMHCIFVEQCGTWQNFYQKRFVYIGAERGVQLGWFNKDKDLWSCRKKIATSKVLYILGNESHMKTIMNTTPIFEHEMFSLTYKDWKDDSYAKNLHELFHKDIWKREERQLSCEEKCKKNPKGCKYTEPKGNEHLLPCSLFQSIKII